MGFRKLKAKPLAFFYLKPECMIKKLILCSYLYESLKLS